MISLIPPIYFEGELKKIKEKKDQCLFSITQLQLISHQLKIIAF